jgi:hypothetical protein
MTKLKWQLQPYGYNAKSSKGMFHIQFDDFDNSWCLFLNKKPVGYYGTMEDAKQGGQDKADYTVFKKFLGRLKRTYQFILKEFDL